jgi:hypothetical protein
MKYNAFINEKYFTKVNKMIFSYYTLMIGVLAVFWEYVALINESMHKPSIYLTTSASYIYNLGCTFGLQISFIVKNILKVFQLDKFCQAIHDLGYSIWKLTFSFTGFFDGFYEGIASYYSNNKMMVTMGTTFMIGLIGAIAIYLYHHYEANNSKNYFIPIVTSNETEMPFRSEETIKQLGRAKRKLYY